MFFLLRRVLFGFFKKGEAPVGCRRLPPIHLRIPTKILNPTHRFCYRAQFANAQRNRLKLLFWDGSGLWVCAKRLEKGRFRWPESASGQAQVVLSHEELALLLGGIDLAQTKRRRWYRTLSQDERTLA